MVSPAPQHCPFGIDSPPQALEARHSHEATAPFDARGRPGNQPRYPLDSLPPLYSAYTPSLAPLSARATQLPDALRIAVPLGKRSGVLTPRFSLIHTLRIPRLTPYAIRTALPTLTSLSIQPPLLTFTAQPPSFTYLPALPTPATSRRVDVGSSEGITEVVGDFRSLSVFPAITFCESALSLLARNHSSPRSLANLSYPLLKF